MAFWTGLRVQPILSDEVQTFKALITVHKVLQEGHPVVRFQGVLKACIILSVNTEHQGSTRADWLAGDMRPNYKLRWLERCVIEATCIVSKSWMSFIGYGSLIRTYVAFLLSKLRFHRVRPEFNGLFEYEEYVTLKGIDDPNEG